MKRIGLFLGTERGYNVLEALINKKYNICGVLVLQQQDHELNNFTKKIIDKCKSNKIPFQTSKKIKSSNYQVFLKKINPDVVFVVSWRYLIAKECFNIPKFGIFILHDSLLPKYRGFSPTNWVIINGEKETGLSLIYINESVDSGDIVDQYKIKINKNESASTLNYKFLELYPKIILKNINLILKKENKRKKQKSSIATYGAKRIPDDGKIDFNKKTLQIIRLIRGLSYPYPGAFCFYRNRKVIIWEAEIPKNPLKFSGRVPGKIITLNNDFCDVLSLDGTIRIKTVSKYDFPFHQIRPNKIFKSIGGNLT